MHSIRIGTRVFFVLLIYLTVDALAATNSQWYQPTVGIKWQWQLRDVVNPNYDVELYDIDLFDSSEVLIRSLQSSGKKVICYFSAGSYENWRSDIAFFNESDRGNSLDGWPDEQWLDIRSEDVADIMRARLVLAKQKGCDGVEPDNVDGKDVEIAVRTWLLLVRSRATRCADQA